jgi:quercetin dioxygenase-like cupin family protein
MVFNFIFVPEFILLMKNTVSTIIHTFVLGLLITCQKANRLPDPLAAGWEGKAVCELVSEDDKLRVLRCTFAPGVGHEKHYHSANFGYIIAGSLFRIRDTTGVREIDLVTGGSFTSEGTNWHEVLNIGDSTAVFLIIEPK